MSCMQKPVKTMIASVMSAIMASTVSHAGAFSLYTEGSGAAIGNFGAGIAAEAADASTGWFNPAGLVLLDKEQAVFSGVGVFPSIKLTGNSTFATTGFEPYRETFTQLQASTNAVVPALHYAKPLGERAAFGLSVVVPFGLATEYSNTSPVRYAATLTDLLTINVSPQLAGQLTEQLSVGAGLDLQWSQVKFNRMLGAPTLLAAGGNPPTAFDSLSDNEGHSVGIGFHVGILGAFNDRHTRIGLNYQSKVKHKFHGFSELSGPLADPFVRDPDAIYRTGSLSSNEIEFPDVVTLSAYQDVNENLTLLGSVVYTGWDVFRIIQLNKVAAFTPTLGQIIVNSPSEQDYRNTWRFALGVNYHLNDHWMMRAGFGYDQTPTVDVQRDIRLPDANRWALAIGGHYQMWPSLGFDAGYTYLFANQETVINKIDALGTSASYTVQAHGKPHAHLVGVQAVWTIDHPQDKQ